MSKLENAVKAYKAQIDFLKNELKNHEIKFQKECTI